MAYTDIEWRNKQVTVVDPNNWMNSNEIKKVTRGYTLGNDIISGVNSFIVTKTGEQELTISPGHAIKQDMYIHFHENVVLDITDVANYCVPAAGIIDAPGIYYIVLDYQYAKTDPSPIAKILIAKTYEIATAQQTIVEEGGSYVRTVNRYLYLSSFEVVEDSATGDLVVSEIYATDPNHPELSRTPIDLFYAAGVGGNNTSGLTSLMVHQTAMASDKVHVESGIYINSNNTGIIKFTGGESDAFSGTSTDDKYRYDLLCIDDNRNLHIVSGLDEYDTQQDPYAVEPGIPDGEYPLAIIEVHGTTPIITDSQIFDARPIINNGTGGGGISGGSLRYEIKDDWDGNSTDWVLPFQIDVSKPYFIFRDHILLKQGEDYTIDQYTIHFNTAPQSFTAVYSFPVVMANDQYVIPPVSRMKADWDGNSNIWYLDFAPNTNYPLAIFADSRHLEPGIDYTIENNTEIHFTFNPQSYTYLIAHATLVGPEIAEPKVQVFIANEGQTTFTTNFSYTPGTNDLSVYRNGVLVDPNNIREISSNDFEILNTNILVNDVIIAKKIGLVPTELYNKDISEVISPIEEVVIVSQDGQTDISTTQITWTVGKHQIEVYVNGQKISENHYSEITGNTVRFDEGLVAGDEITIRKLGISPTGTYNKIGSIVCKKTGADIDSNTGDLILDFSYDIGQGQIQVFINNLAYFSGDDYTESGNNKITFSSDLLANIQDTDVIRVMKFYAYS